MAATALYIFLAYSTGATAHLAEVPPAVQQAIADLEKRYPPVETNSAAIELEGLAANLGIDLAPQLPNRRHPSEEARKRFDEARVGFYVAPQIERADDDIGPPPESTSAFLAAHEAVIRAAIRALVEGEAPRWELDVRKGWKNSVSPNYQGQIAFHKLLIAQALVDTREGRGVQSASALEASWRLNDSLVGRPELIAQLIALAAARLEVGTLRRVPGPPTVWIDRLAFTLLRSSVISSVRDDGILVLMSETEDVRRSEELAAYVGGMRRASEALATQDPCGFTEEFAAGFWKSFFVGKESAILGEIAMPSFSNAVFRMFRLLLAAELTRKLIDARAAKRASSDGRWPSELPDSDSRACPGSAWSYALSVDGGVTIEFGGTSVDWPGESGPKLPLSFSASSHP
jgi:hypothetical protein